MKKFLFILMCIAAFTVGTTGCIFEDVEDDTTAAFACAIVAFCLFCYVLKCFVQSLSTKEQERIAETLSRHSESP